MFGVPEANSFILGCWDAQWDGFGLLFFLTRQLVRKKTCLIFARMEMFDSWSWTKRIYCEVNVSLSQREATDSQSLLLSPSWILPLGLSVRLEIGVSLGFVESLSKRCYTPCVHCSLPISVSFLKYQYDKVCSYFAHNFLALLLNIWHYLSMNVFRVIRVCAFRDKGVL